MTKEFTHTYVTIGGQKLKCRIIEERPKRYRVIKNENGVNVYLKKRHLKKI
jgi:hypothetical protein